MHVFSLLVNCPEVMLPRMHFLKHVSANSWIAGAKIRIDRWMRLEADGLLTALNIGLLLLLLDELCKFSLVLRREALEFFGGNVEVEFVVHVG